MTRRLDPHERIDELSSASVPFPFDVHMMITTENAPELETKLHDFLDENRINRVNLRKEFFRADLEEIRKFIEENHSTVSYKASPEAFEYRESMLLAEGTNSTPIEEGQENRKKVA